MHDAAYRFFQSALQCQCCIMWLIHARHMRRRPPVEEEELLKQALLGADVEAPPAKQKRAWCVA